MGLMEGVPGLGPGVFQAWHFNLALTVDMQ